ncbi:MAG: HEAT repeat domain-containing protein, partial [Planctomycetes bacterium]|nr:HEAT repeat domain-containing protein [Planctomycetota bacterium]
VYICAHLLGFTAQTRSEEKPDDGLPPALTRVESEQEKKQAATYLRATNTSRQMMESTEALGNAWFDKNLTFDVEEWTHYYMYALERYKAFQELTEGKSVAEPDWYNKGVEYLKETQRSDGSWKTKKSDLNAPFVDTAFAMLFLTRSSQRSIQKAVLDEGILIGGKGLPKNLLNAKVVDGQVVTPQMVRDVDDLMELLSKADDKDFDATALPSGLPLDQDLDKRTSQLVRLREMVTDPDFQKRLAAVKTLAASHELENVPALIYALSDPDARVMRAARDGLRLISRKLRGFGLSNSPSPQEVAAARQQWKDWYLAIRPDGEFLD